MSVRTTVRETRRAATIGCVAVLVTVLVAGCSSSSGGGGAAPTHVPGTTPDRAGVDIHGGAHPCALGAHRKAPEVTPASMAGVAPADRANRTDLEVTSFDGSRIFAHWFPVPGASKAKPAPTVLMGPGWSIPGDTDVHGTALFGASNIGTLRARGYNVVTWDPRGFGRSGGQVEIDSPDVEGRDVQALIDVVAQQPQALLDRAGDPRVGMIGLSYGGGIQLSTAAIDCRVDAIVPGWAWHSLHTSLYENDTVKVGWDRFLYSAAVRVGAHLDPHIVDSATHDLPVGRISAANLAWYERHSLGPRVDDITIPTLFVSGIEDNLFTLDEAVTNYRSLQDRGVPTEMIWMCGGHGTCLTKPGDTALVGTRSLQWLDTYLTRGDGPIQGLASDAVDLVDQDGVRWQLPSYPPPAGSPVTAHGSGQLRLVAAGGSGPITSPPTDVLGGLVAGITPAKATNAVDVTIRPHVDALAVGAPALRVTYEGTATGPDAPERAFAQLVDDDTGFVVGNQVTPFAVVLDGHRHTATVPMEIIAQHLRPGHTLTLQLVATTAAYSLPRLGGQIRFADVRISIPVATVRPSR